MEDESPLIVGGNNETQRVKTGSEIKEMLLLPTAGADASRFCYGREERYVLLRSTFSVVCFTLKPRGCGEHVEEDTGLSALQTRVPKAQAVQREEGYRCNHAALYEEVELHDHGIVVCTEGRNISAGGEPAK